MIKQELKKFIIAYFYILIRDLFYGKSGVIDVKDTRDYTYGEVVGNVPEFPSKFDESYRLSQFQNQRDWKNEGGLVWCGPTSSSMGTDILGLENTNEFKTGKEFALALDSVGKMFSFGTYLADNPKYLKKLGLIEGYYKVSTPEQAKNVLYNGFPILLGYNRLRNINGTLQVRKTGGHLIVALPKYDEEYLYCADPWTGEEVRLPWNLWEYLFYSKYVLDTSENIRIIDEIKRDIKGIRGDRIEIYLYLLGKYGKKNKKQILLVMRANYNMNITDEMYDV